MKKKRLLALIICTGLGVFSFIYFQFFLKNPSYIHIPVITFSPFGVPMIEVRIGKIKCLLEVDLGSSFSLDLTEKTLKKLKNKTREPNQGVRDVRYNLYDTQSFRIPAIQLSKWEIKDLIAIQEIAGYTENTIFFLPSEAVKKTLLKQIAKIKQGTIGCPVFTPFASFFDFSRSNIIIAKNMAALWESGCLTDKFIKVPFDFCEEKIIFSVTTDIGTHRLLLDTGATCSMIRESLALRLAPKERIEEIEVDVKQYVSHAFVSDQLDLGTWAFRLFDMSNDIDYFDGALGMDFFRKHPIALDFPNKTAYIQP